MENEKPLSKKL
jgi:hypothetical protein